ncbi:MAG: DUF72 domain-containing protein [Tepidisphaeraceae bacterium]
MSHKTCELRVGMSGWTYPPWRGEFYPKGISQKRELEYASRRLNSIEINGSFYSLQRPASYQAWYDQTPDDFVFAMKGGGFITHIRRLRDVKTPLANFFASGVLNLKGKLGPILWQFPENFHIDLKRFEEFFELLPRDTKQASKLARGHGKLKFRASTTTDQNREVRYAVEVRHSSYLDRAFFKLLRKHNIAIVIADAAGKWPSIEDITADFLYLRLHGDKELYVSGYTDDAIQRWADRINKWRTRSMPSDARLTFPDLSKRPPRCRAIFVYFDTDVKVRSPLNAVELSRRLGLRPPEDAMLASRDRIHRG